MIKRILMVTVLSLMGALPANAGASLTFTAPWKATPDTVTAMNGVKVAGITASLIGFNTWNPLMQATLDAQGFGTVNNYFYAAADVASYIPGQAQPVPFANDANFNVTKYELKLNLADKNEVGETMDFDLKPGGTKVPTLAGATITPHWLQLIHSDVKVNNYGYAITGQAGFWQVDNGQKDWSASPGNGPWYDSNSAPGDFSTPNGYHDFPHWYDAYAGLYLQFWTVLAWDVNDGKGNNIMVVTDQALTWGFVALPEPSTLIGGGLAIFVITTVQIVRKQRTQLNTA